MQPHFASKDLDLFYRYLDKCTYYFEFGSGGSTYQAALRPHIQHIYTVESDFMWFSDMTDILKHKQNVTMMYIDLDAAPNNWGHPGPKSTHRDWIAYSNQFVDLDVPDRFDIDLILIDGRFRVACCLKCFELMGDDCFILFDDFLDRDFYHVVLDYFSIVEQTEDCRMVVLKKKKDCFPDMDRLKQLIHQFELISS